MSSQQCKAVKRFFHWLQNILRMEDMTKEQRQAARKRAWRKNGHSGGKDKAAQQQKPDLDEPIQCKMPPKKDGEGEEMVPEPTRCKMPSEMDDKGEHMVPEPVPCKMPSKKHDEGEKMVQFRPKPATSHEASQHQVSDLDEPVPCKMPSKRYDKGEKMVLVRPKAVASHGREKMFLVRPRPVASPQIKDHRKHTCVRRS